MASALPHLPSEIGDCCANTDELEAKENPDQPQGRDRQVRPQDQCQQDPHQPTRQHPAPIGKGPDGRAKTTFDTGSGRWTRIEDSWVVEQRVGWCAMRRGGEPWRGLLII